METQLFDDMGKLLIYAREAHKNLENASFLLEESKSQSDLESKLEYFYATRDYLTDYMEFTEKANKISGKYTYNPKIYNYLKVNTKTFDKAKQALIQIDDLIEKYKTNLGIS